MRRTITIVCAAAMLVAGGIWAVAAAGSAGPVATRAPTQTGLIRATRFYGVGPSADYDFDAGNIGTVPALRVTFPAGTTYDVVVTISLDYRTSADDRFVVSPLVRRDREYGHVMTGLPSARAVSAATARTSTTAAFRYADLPGGREFWFSPTVNVSHRVGNRASIGARHVLLVVEATPSG